MKIWLQSYIIEISQTKGDLYMPGFFTGFFILFFILFITAIVFNITRVGRMNKQHKTPIKQFRHEGETYKIYAKQSFNRYYSNQVVYELRNDREETIGTFNSLKDILVLLNLENFPSKDIFDR